MKSPAKDTLPAQGVPRSHSDAKKFVTADCVKSVLAVVAKQNLPDWSALNHGFRLDGCFANLFEKPSITYGV